MPQKLLKKIKKTYFITFENPVEVTILVLHPLKCSLSPYQDSIVISLWEKKKSLLTNRGKDFIAEKINCFHKSRE